MGPMDKITDKCNMCIINSRKVTLGDHPTIIECTQDTIGPSPVDRTLDNCNCKLTVQELGS